MKEWIEVNAPWANDQYFELSTDYYEIFDKNYKDERFDELMGKVNFNDIEPQMSEFIDKLDIDDFNEEGFAKLKGGCNDVSILECFELETLLNKKRLALDEFFRTNEDYLNDVGLKAGFAESNLCRPGIEIEIKKANGDIVKYIVGDVNLNGCGNYSLYDDKSKIINDEDIVLRYRDLKGEE